MPVRAPGDEELLAEVAAAGPEEVDCALAAADAAWPAWAALAPAERGRALAAYAGLIDAEQETLARLVHREVGKPLAEAAAEVARAAEVVHHFAAEAERVWASQVPGATLASGSWTRPAPVGWWRRSCPGTSPSRWWSGSSPRPWRPAARWSSSPPRRPPWPPGRSATWPSGAGLPPGLVTCLTGDGPLLGEALATHPRVAKVAFTGSRRVKRADRRLGGALRLKLSLELGGHGPLVVLPDADLDVAAEVAVSQGYVNAGQACYAVNRVLCPRAWPATCSSACAPASPQLSSARWPPSAAWRATACCSRTPAPRGRGSGGKELGGGGWRRRRDRRRPWRAPGRRGPFTPIVAVMEVLDTAAAIAEANRPDYGLVGYVAALTCAGRSRRPRRSPAARW